MREGDPLDRRTGTLLTAPLTALFSEVRNRTFIINIVSMYVY